ncbi:SAF domain-containing protein [Paenibacillus turpanensis]|uniref:SAF domain-containing protein n=1 Tax=Paenibacillus turpanensis TaxID=2689078 RepID=UPI00140C0D86|nr:SAF domain-containing protein [Paenibacillus turpanensis]
MAVRKVKKVVLYSTISGILVAILTSGVWFATYRFYTAKLLEERQSFEKQLAQRNSLLQRYQDESKKAYVLQSAKQAGEIIGAMDLREEKIPSHVTPGNVVLDPKDLVGKHLKINALAGTMLTSDMVRDASKMDSTERKHESQYIRLPLRIQKTDVVDIRIVFPNGEDYIVVAKKKLSDVHAGQQLAFFNVTEEELMILQSALVDSYMREAELYAVPYVDPEFQERAVVTYVPTMDVLRAMQTDPGIIDKAKLAAMALLRPDLDRRMNELPEGSKVRIGADLPSGSGVSKRISEGGRAPLGPEEEGVTVPQPAAPNPGMQPQTQANTAPVQMPVEPPQNQGAPAADGTQPSPSAPDVSTGNSTSLLGG